MPGFKNTIPQPNDDLSVSQGDLLLNFQSCNASFGIDHYPFTDLSTNDGKHNKVTTPVFNAVLPNTYPTTIAGEPIFFAATEKQSGSTLPLGTLQYSVAPLSPVPSPLTTLQSPVAPIVIVALGTLNVIDFTGLTDCVFLFYLTPWTATSTRPTNLYTGHYFSLPTPTIQLSSATGAIGLVQDAGAGILQIKNTSASSSINVEWTLQIIRILQ